MLQTQILRSVMFSSQKLCWQNTRADSGAGMLMQNKSVESAAHMSFPLLGDVCLCVRTVGLFVWADRRAKSASRLVRM